MLVLLIVLACTVTRSSACGDPHEISETESHPDITPVHSLTHVAIPPSVLLPFIRQTHLWPTWNHAYKSSSGAISECSTVSVDFVVEHGIPITLPSQCEIYAINATASSLSYAWQYSGPGLFGVHKTSILPADAQAQSSVYSNWEAAKGASVKLLSHFWESQFAFVGSQTSKGLACLASVYNSTGALLPQTVATLC